MALNIPLKEVKQTILLLTNIWAGPGHLSMDIFNPTKEKFKVTIRTTNKNNFALITMKELAEYAGCKGMVINPPHK